MNTTICSLEQHQQLADALQKQLKARRYETHISTVLIADGLAWKLKKPLNLGFLDFSTLEKRHFCCEEEIRLNSRLAPDVYQSVVAISGTPEAPVLDDMSAPIEYAVQMREFPADALLADHPDLLNDQSVDDIALQITIFQSSACKAEPGSVSGSPHAVLAPMRQNFAQIRANMEETSVLAQLDRIEAWTLQQFERLEPLLEQRQQSGFIREGHGDLHLGNIAVEDGRFILFDGIEFNPGLRWIDVTNEISFLMMDLDRHHQQALSQRFLNSWLMLSGDYEGLQLLRFYQVYRAMVRAKIAALRLAQQLEDVEHKTVSRDFHDYLNLADSYMQKEKPLLIITCGPSGSGKSVAARALIKQLPAVHILSDIERKRLAGLKPLDNSRSGQGEGIYSQAMSDKTYQRLEELSQLVIEAGYTAIADATFLKRTYRRPFQQLAKRLKVPFRILVPETDEQELFKRVEARLARGDDPAEANVEVLKQQLLSIEPLDEKERECAVFLSAHQINSGITAEIMQ